MEQWESVGDYAIGISLIIIACHFAWQESAYVETHADGSSSLRQCEHDHGGGTMRRSSLRAPANDAAEGSHAAQFECSLCRKQGPTDGAVTFAERLICAECSSTVAPVEERPVPARWRQKAAVDQRRASVILLGGFQGICCPRSLMGFSFMAELPPQGLACFIVTFLAVSVLGRGLLAAAWASLTQLGLGTCVPVKVVYRASYALTLLLGLVWTWATFSGFVAALESLAHTEGAAPGPLPAAWRTGGGVPARGRGPGTASGRARRGAPPVSARRRHPGTPPVPTWPRIGRCRTGNRKQNGNEERC
ncbi:unnamed protein product [Prorocentrum cordatum]|uniref:Uncharacterized protein n=1 Tax=Prorocentrum cordatum TaxID=2364126 RepID=A0ABN9UJV1_9DINO|nr:unnamed protein product [Polarella glacialis]